MQSQLSTEDVARLKSLLEEIDSGGVPDPYLQLLNALEPFLSERQRERLPTAKALVKFLRSTEGGHHA